MVSAYQGPSIGLGASTEITEEALARINAYRVGTYISTEAAIDVLGTDKKAPFADAQAVRDRLCVRFHHGKENDGYWNNYQQLVQHEDMFDIIRGLFPAHDIDSYYDQSSGHAKKMRGALNASRMNKFWGGEQPHMNASLLTNLSTGGPHGHDKVVKPGYEQQMQFGHGPDADGPWYLTAAERESTRHPSGTKECPKTRQDLKNDLQNLGIPFKNSERKQRLVEIATAANIPLVKNVPEKQGWEGAPKGALQILWERGFIDPDEPIEKYSMNAKKDWLDEDGDVKEEYKKFYLLGLLEELPDFKTSKTELENLAELLTEATGGRVKCSIFFTPKYHCEIAGLGIELAWGLIKKYYRRWISLDRKKKDFSGCVQEALQQVTKTNVRNFCARIHRYLIAYKHFDSKDVDETSYEAIEKFVKTSKKCHRSSMDLETAYLDNLLKEMYGLQE